MSGALCYAGDIGGLSEKTIRLGHIDQPLRKNAAAQAAECKYRDRNGAFAANRDHHASLRRRFSVPF